MNPETLNSYVHCALFDVFSPNGMKRYKTRMVTVYRLYISKSAKNRGETLDVCRIIRS